PATFGEVCGLGDFGEAQDAGVELPGEPLLPGGHGELHMVQSVNAKVRCAHDWMVAFDASGKRSRSSTPRKGWRHMATPFGAVKAESTTLPVLRVAAGSKIKT